MTRKTVVHLCDDDTAGGVTRVLDHIKTCKLMAQDAQHEVMYIRRGTTKIGRIKADIVVSHLSVSWRTLACHITLRALNPTVPLMHVEHSYSDGFLKHNVKRKGRFATLLRTTYALYDQIVAVSHAQGRWLAETGLVRPTQLAVIQSTVPYEAFRSLSAPEGAVKVFGAIGRMDRQKGFDVLIEAFKKTQDPNIELRLYGKGPEEEALQDLARSDSRIKFMGFWSNPSLVLASLDAVLMPSRWEAYGLVAAEALQAKRPVLLNNVDGLKDHIENGATVVMAPDANTWSLAITKLAGRKPQLAPNTSANHRAEDVFADSWKRVMGNLLHQPVALQP